MALFCLIEGIFENWALPFFKIGRYPFSKLGVTRMMCVHENMEQEFLKEIATITKYKIIDSELHLFKSDELNMIFKKE